MRSRPPLSLMRNLRSLAVVVLATLPCIAFAQWRVVAVSTEVDAMRFNTIMDAHSFMKSYRIEEEKGYGEFVSEKLYPVEGYGDGRYTSRICFKYVGGTASYDPETCTGGGNADLPQKSLKARAPRNSLIINAEVISHNHFPQTRPEKRFSPLISRHRTRVTGLR